MPFSNRVELRASLANWLMRAGDTEMTDAVLNDIIALMEADAFRRLDLNDVETRDNAFVLAGEFTTLPTGFKGFRAAPRVSTGGRLKLYSPSQMDDSFDPTDTDDPIAYCIQANQLRVGPIPSGSITLDITYFGRPAAITDAGSNFLMDDNPDLYLYGSLVHAAPFIGEDGRMPMWKTNYEQAMATIAAADRRKKWSGSPGEMRIAGGTP